MKTVLKEKKSLLSYIPFLDTKPTYELSDEFKERLSDDENYLETKKHLLAKLKTRDDVNKDDLKFLENQIEKTSEKKKEKDTFCRQKQKRHGDGTGSYSRGYCGYLGIDL